MRVYANWVQGLFAEASAELDGNAGPAAVRRIAEEMLADRHSANWAEISSGRSEEFPSDLTARHAQEWKDFERLAPIRPDGRPNMVLARRSDAG